MLSLDAEDYEALGFGVPDAFEVSVGYQRLLRAQYRRQAEYNLRYRKTDAGKQATARYGKSEKGREARARYEKTEKFKEARRRANRNYYLKKVKHERARASAAKAKQEA